MKARGLLAVVVMCLVVFLRPMAFASPPDQSWIGGFFDNADYDDVILLITGATPATVTAHVGGDPRPAQVVVMPVAEADETPVPALFVSSHHTRAPPSL